MLDFRRYVPDYLTNALQALVILLVLFYFITREDTRDNGIELTSGAPSFYEHWQWQIDANEFDIDSKLERLELDDRERDRQIRDLLHRGEYQQARTQLLEVAAASVLQDNQQRLGDTLLLLGEVAINQQELTAAEIYLQEALHLSIEHDDLLGTARCYQLLGQLNIRARQLARHAANTHDVLWQARNATSRGLYHGVDGTLRAVIAKNMEIRRYGAAADAWEAMAALQDRLHDTYQAQQARIEAARLYASTGRVTHVRRLLEGLDRGQITDDEYRQLEFEIEQQLQARHQDVVRTSQARNYRMLYHHYLRQGEIERAWKFRIKSSATLANTSDRAMFQRQSDIIAVLYSSNFAMDRARKYLDQAGAIYDEQDVPELLRQTRDMEIQIY